MSMFIGLGHGGPLVRHNKRPRARAAQRRAPGSGYLDK